MEKVAILFTDYILKKDVISEEDYEIYRYGFQIGMEMMICIVVCYLAAIYMHMIGECTVLLLIMFSLRSYVGGLHMDSYWICFLCSCIVVIGTLAITKHYVLSPINSVIISIVEVLVIHHMLPVENKNRPVDHEEKKIFARMINKVLLMIVAFMMVCLLIGLKRYLSIITYTLGIILIAMILGGLKNRYRLA